MKHTFISPRLTRERKSSSQVCVNFIEAYVFENFNDAELSSFMFMRNRGALKEFTASTQILAYLHSSYACLLPNLSYID